MPSNFQDDIQQEEKMQLFGENHNVDDLEHNNDHEQMPLNTFIMEQFSHEWFNELYKLAALPKPYDYTSASENFATAIAIACCMCASILYILGSEEEGVEYIIGGVAVNALQTFFFTKETITFFSKVHDQKQRTIISLFFALFSTAVSSIATFQMSKSGTGIAVVEALMVAAGNLPQNLYGMFESIKRLLDAHQDNPDAREYLLDRLRETVDEHDDLKGLVPEKRGLVNRVANNVVSLGIGVFLSLSQTGYIRSSVGFIRDLTGNKAAGLTLGLMTNLPGLCISMFISSKVLGEAIVNITFDTGKYALKKAMREDVAKWTLRESGFFAGKAIVAGGFSVLAHYSAATSLSLYYDPKNGPIPYIPSNDTIDTVIRVAINQGCQVFNGVMAIMGTNNNIDYLNKAYVAPESEDLYRLKIVEMVEQICKQDITTIKDLATRAGWIDTQAIPAGYGGLGLHGRRFSEDGGQNDYHLLGNANLNIDEEPEIGALAAIHR